VSENTGHAGRAPRGEGWSDEDLLQLLLEGRADELARARAESGARQRLAELETFLERWRAPLAELSGAIPPGREERLARRVLARTTRLDTGWRGNVARLTGFARDRLARSALLRCAAVLLLVSAIGLPLLAWLWWSGPQRATLTAKGPETEALEPRLPADSEASQLAQNAPNARDAETGEVSLPDADQVERSLQAAADALRDTTWPRASSSDSWTREPALRWLAMRAKAGSTAVRVPPGAERDWRQSEGRLTGLERALRAELLLDRLALGDPDPPGLEQDLAALGSDADESAATRRLEALALERGRACGRLAPAAWDRLAASGATVGARASDPLDEEWRAALREALASDRRLRTALADASLQGWLEGGGRPR
jgi:hypothetical protein